MKAAFTEHLKRDGFEFVQSPGVTAGTLILSVVARTIAALQPTVERANEAAALEYDKSHFAPEDE